LNATDALQTSPAYVSSPFNNRPKLTRAHRQNLPPNYVGALTHRGTITPFSSKEVKTKMWVTKPGIYGLNGWRLETEVGGTSEDLWVRRALFSQEPPAKEESIVIVVQ